MQSVQSCFSSCLPVTSDGPFSRRVLAVVYQSSQTDGRRDSLAVCHSLSQSHRQTGQADWPFSLSCLSCHVLAVICLSRLSVTDGTSCPVCRRQTGQADWPFSVSRHVLGRPQGKSSFDNRYRRPLLTLIMVATNLENLEKSGNLKVVRKKSWKICSCLWCASYNTFLLLLSSERPIQISGIGKVEDIGLLVFCSRPIRYVICTLLPGTNQLITQA